MSKETFILQCLTLELWTTVGGPIGDGHMVCLLTPPEVKRKEILYKRYYTQIWPNYSPIFTEQKASLLSLLFISKWRRNWTGKKKSKRLISCRLIWSDLAVLTELKYTLTKLTNWRQLLKLVTLFYPQL